MTDAGGWIEFEIPWNETSVRNCPVCGKLVTRRAWQFQAPEGMLRVCEPDCQQLYESYFRAKHGPLQPGALEGTIRSGSPKIAVSPRGVGAPGIEPGTSRV